MQDLRRGAKVSPQALDPMTEGRRTGHPRPVPMFGEFDAPSPRRDDYGVVARMKHRGSLAKCMARFVLAPVLPGDHD